MSPNDRTKDHAKLVTFNRRQVVAFLYRDENDALCVALQLWVASSDEQLRAVIAGEDDEQTLAMFATLSDETIENILRNMDIFDDVPELEGTPE